VKAIRYILGRVILFFDWLTTPKSMERSEGAQQQVNERLQAYSLFELPACPFCVKTRRECKRLGLAIKTFNMKTDSQAKQLLEQEGGKYQVPCLRITADNGSEQWLYESSDIIAKLRTEFL
jgi:glutaredoxin